MMGFLAQQLTRLRRANGLRVDGEEDEIARQMAASLGAAEGQGESTVIRSATPAVASVGAGGGTEGGAPAPARSPVAPRRPG